MVRKTEAHVASGLIYTGQLLCVGRSVLPYIPTHMFSILYVLTHRENKAHVNLGSGHLFLLAQVQK